MNGPIRIRNCRTGFLNTDNYSDTFHITWPVVSFSVPCPAWGWEWPEYSPDLHSPLEPAHSWLQERWVQLTFSREGKEKWLEIFECPQFCPVLVFVLGDFCPHFCTWNQRKFNKYPTTCSVYCELDVWHAVKVWFLKQAGNLYSTLYFFCFSRYRYYPTAKYR
jgi:hypothetical protein